MIFHDQATITDEEIAAIRGGKPYGGAAEINRRLRMPKVRGSTMKASPSRTQEQNSVGDLVRIKAKLANRKLSLAERIQGAEQKPHGRLEQQIQASMEAQ